MVSKWLPHEEVRHILAALMPANRLVCEVQLATGLRIGDVLALKREAVSRGRFTIKEEKTGKSRRVRIPEHLQAQLLAQSGRVFVFEGRLDQFKHRTRQAVFKDIKRACKAFRITEQISPHSMRKVFATEFFHKTGDIKRVQKLLNHSDEAVTFIYAMADVLSTTRKKY